MGKKFSWIFGIVFLIVGILGFIANPLVGPTGFFFTDTVHNIIHLVSGLLFIWVAISMPGRAAVTMKVFGLVYLVVAILGFFTIDMSGTGSILGVVGINSADNWLHVALGLLIGIIGFASSRPAEPIQTV